MSLQYKKGICTCHGKEQYIVKKILPNKYCNDGNQARLKARREQQESNGTIKPLKRLSRHKKPTGEKVLFEVIWNTRPRVSFLDGKPLGECAYAWTFAHCLRKAKGHFPEFKLYDKNIMLLTKRQHELFDDHVRTPDFLIEKDHRWQKIFDLRDELLMEYEKAHGL